ncbi:MAG: hypothetical protein JOY60_08375 [Burkholderiaceae bacterium]|nr:hypothetical protein [Roseateles sp.]MBV8469859.1 hypothetical protein [Burkholderiaceae bacterium]
MSFALRRTGPFSARTRRLLGTAAASYLARLCAALTLLLTVPLARSTMSADRFGLWMMLGSLLSFFAFADLGIGNGVLAQLTQALHRNDSASATGRIMRAGYACSLLGAFGLLLGWVLWVGLSSDPLRFAGHIAPQLRGEALIGISTFVGLMGLNLVLQLGQKFQLAYQDGHWIGYTQVASSLGTVVALPIALWLRAPLSILVACTLGSQALALGLSTILWFRHRHLGPSLQQASLHGATVKGLLQTGLMFFTLQLSAAFAYQSDAFVITQELGTAAYGDFAAIQRIFLSVGTLVGAALLGLWPAFSEAMARGDVRWARHTYFRALGVGTGIMGSVCALITFGMPLIAKHWLHMTAPPTILMPLVLSIWTVIDTLGQITGTLLNGAGVLRAQLLVALMMAGFAFWAKWVFVSHFGPWGAVLATIVAYTLISVPAQIWLVRPLLSSKVAAT